MGGQGEKSRFIKTGSLFIAGGILLVLLFAAGIFLGTAKIGFSEVMNILTGRLSDGDFPGKSIVMDIRLPRMLAAAVGGAALALSGLLLQAFFRNPIVEPYVLGISSGSTLFVSLVLLAGVKPHMNSTGIPVVLGASFLGALSVMAVIIAAANLVKNVNRLLLLGLIIGYICNSIISMLSVFAKKEGISGLVIWSMGSFSGFTWLYFKVMGILCLLAFLAAFTLCKPLNGLMMGEAYASSIGVDIMAVRLIILAVSCLLVSVVTAFAGPVAFIGFCVPHIARMLFSTQDNRVLIPASMLLGSIITGLCDIAARIVFAPAELAISAVTSFVGAPMLIYMLSRKKGGSKA